MESLEGWKTAIAAFAGAVMSLMVAFGIDLTDEQRAAILAVLATGASIVMLVLRLRTNGPVAPALQKIPGAKTEPRPAPKQPPPATPDTHLV